MGMFDTVFVPCVKCKNELSFQTKSGPCELRGYPLENAPEDVLRDVNRHAPIKCACGTFNAVLTSGMHGAFVVEVVWTKERQEAMHEKVVARLKSDVEEQ